jgi:pyridinium-3,5-bisthiocarboxylic acid mononucleotide nickel chelatase
VIAYFDCFAGASGDMILGALIDAGAEVSAIEKSLEAVGIALGQLTVSRVVRLGISGVHVEVGGSSKSAIRTLAEATRLFDGAKLDHQVGRVARGVFERLAAAEARVHGIAPEEVGLHEIDGADTIADVVGSAAALAQLGIDEVVCSPVTTGRGWVGSRHGPLPVPAPAALELLRGAPVAQTDIDAELVTPTGAAILAEIATSFGPMPLMKVASIGYGAGSQELAIPNLLRVIIGERVEQERPAADAVVISATIDDMNPELYEFVIEKLYAVGADDVWIAPVIGKRGRPAAILNVLATPPLESRVGEVLVTETSTIGLRATSVRKQMLEREWVDVTVEGAPVRVKVARSDGKVANVAPEYADCAEAARKTGVPLKEIFRRATELAHRQLLES